MSRNPIAIFWLVGGIIVVTASRDLLDNLAQAPILTKVETTDGQTITPANPLVTNVTPPAVVQPPKLAVCRESYPTLTQFVDRCVLFGIGVGREFAEAKCCGFLEEWLGVGSPNEGCLCGKKRFDDANAALTGTPLARILGVNTFLLINV
ncbi:hypothetical protein BSKO_04090 [Bryopsis sp. KO-2023]|nr:hypothetical protein BSKO_04090 [Bryopsis sp. KO-2023]